jgi:PKD repeat protein
MLVLPKWSAAQCEYQGLVLDVSGINDCELAIVSPGLPVLELPANPYGLTAGDQIYFSYDTIAGQASCGLGLPVSLSCVFVAGNGGGTTCDAAFSWYPVDPANDPYSFHFQPYVGPPLGLAWAWDFGDGQSSYEMAPSHTFQQDGEYVVCLTLTDLDGCEATHCDTLLVGDVPAYCDFAVEVMINGLELNAEVYNVTDFGPYHPQVVKWINAATGEILGDSAQLVYTLPDSSYLEWLCVEYEVEYPGGFVCASSWCGDIWEANACIDSALINLAIDCPAVFLPVCGCDGVTYANACEAEYYNGVSAWTPGPCAGGYGQCVAYFHMTALDDTTFLLMNTSVGDYDQFHWILDGGQPFGANMNPLEINLPAQGYHTICVEIWDTNTGCTSIYCQEFYCGDPNYQCSYTDCVWPGDANADYVANVYDLLNIGLGYGSIGLPRPDAHLNWEGQPAPDWGVAVTSGIDYKHIDCNGDGHVIHDDLEAIDLNYVAGTPPWSDPVDGKLPVYFLFDTDTVFVDASAPAYIPVSGGLYVGEPLNPAIGLHGVGASLKYLQADLIEPWSVAADYLDNSFFGVSNQSLWLSRDLYEEKRIDLGFTRMSGQGVNGYGRIADVNFIIISDIIGGRTDEYIPFELQIEGLQLIDKNGDPILFDLPMPSDTLILVNEISTNVAEQQGPETSIRVHPNPSKGRLWAEWADVEVTSVQVFNALGQELQRLPMAGQGRQEWSLEGLSSGLYTLRFQTDQGVVNKKVVVER